MSEDIVVQLRGWSEGSSDDSRRMVWLMRQSADTIEALRGERDHAAGNAARYLGLLNAAEAQVEAQVEALRGENARLAAQVEALTKGRDDRSSRRRHMSDELIIVKAARNYADDIDNDRGIEMGLPDCLREAANLIERLTAQVDGLQDEIKRLREQVRFASETDPAMRAEAAEAEAARLKGALENLATFDFATDEKISIARKALAGETT